MRTYRECSSCRALLTSGQLDSGSGLCPYCGARIAGDQQSRPGTGFNADNPYEPPMLDTAARTSRPTIPVRFGGKMVLAFRLLFDQLPLFAALVLTVWVPGHLLIDAALAGNPNPPDNWRALQLGQLIELVFGPVYAAAIVTALAARMTGERISYIEAIRAGLHHWGRLFAARILAGLLIVLGLFAFVIPGLILAVRFLLVDEVVVLEGAGPDLSRRRSVQLTAGRGWQLFRAQVLSVGLIMGFSTLLASLMELAGLLNQFPVADICDCLISVLAVFYHCLLFIYYWEARQQETATATELPGETFPES